MLDVEGLEGLGCDVALARNCERVEARTERLMHKANDGVFPFEMVGVADSGAGWDFIRLAPPGGVAYVKSSFRLAFLV